MCLGRPSVSSAPRAHAGPARAAEPALSPLCRLPPELVILIAGLGALDALLALTWLCRAVRAALVGAPDLWAARIDTSVPPALAAACLRRAGEQPLRVTMPKAGARAPLVQYFPRIAALHAEPEGTAALMISLQSRPAPLLETLVLEQSRTRLPLHARALHAETCASLRTLKITGVRVESFPRLPGLRSLELWHASCPLDELHEFLAHTPGLEHIVLGNAMAIRYYSAVPQLERVDLLALQSLCIFDYVAPAAALAQLFPTPRSVFKVHIMDDPMGRLAAWSSTDNVNGWIMSRMSDFWTSRTGGSTPFPPGVVTSVQVPGRLPCARGQLACFIEYCSTRSGIDAAPTLSYQTRCIITEDDPLLSRVEALVVGPNLAADAAGLFISRDRLRVECLPHLEKLAVLGIGCESNHEEHASHQELADTIQALQDALVARVRRGCPLKTIEFHGCGPRMLALFRRLEDEKAVTTTAWMD